MILYKVKGGWGVEKKKSLCGARPVAVYLGCTNFLFLIYENESSALFVFCRFRWGRPGKKSGKIEKQNGFPPNTYKLVY